MCEAGMAGVGKARHLQPRKARRLVVGACMADTMRARGAGCATCIASRYGSTYCAGRGMRGCMRASSKGSLLSVGVWCWLGDCVVSSLDCFCQSVCALRRLCCGDEVANT